MRVAYLVHDVNDPAVHRRIRMLETGGAKVALLGFSRDREISPAALAPLVIGYTADARMLQRALAVAKATLSMPRWFAALAAADVIVARQLETLFLAVLARWLTHGKAPLIYECLDIHRLMLFPGLAGRLLRATEARLLRACDALMVSSPRFVDAYFLPTHGAIPRLELIENKVLESELADPQALPAQRARQRPVAPPWRIGWYGMIRCRRSLGLLADLAKALPGQVEVIIRGRVATSVVPDFDAVVAATPGLVYDGPYDRRNDLPALYSSAHFFWAIDFFDGSSSNWLLQNRLYEGGLFGAIPLALRQVQTGRWLASHHAGVLLDDDLEDGLYGFFSQLDMSDFLAARQAMAAIPVAAFLHDKQDCIALTTRLLFGADKRAAAVPVRDLAVAEI